MTERMIVPATPGPGSYSINMEVLTQNDEFIVQANVPDMRPEDLHIEILGNTVTVHGQFQEESRQEGDMIVVDRRSAQFNRTITLPAPVDPSGAQAIVTNGVLTLRLPRADTPPTKAIVIQSSFS